MASEFDFIIVGGGCAGLVLATRLTEDPSLSVLVIEAGEDLTADPRVNVPAMWTQLQGTSADWSFKTVPQKELGGRELSLPQGRLLGGSGALNGMNFVVTSKANLDAWSELGNPGWDWESFSKAFNKTYSLTTPSKHGEKGGPIQVTIPDEDSKWPEAWRDTWAGLGFPVDNNPMSGNITGAVTYPDSIDPTTKTRSFSGNAYLPSASSRPNFTLWTATLVNKIVFDTSDGIVATGVQYTKDGATKTVSARKEVILSAGTINSPKILELSGIGDAALLRSLGIDVVVDNPHVGENLQNHPFCAISFETVDDSEEGYDTIDSLSRGDTAALGAAMEAYTTKKTGPFSKTNCNQMAHIPVPGITTPQVRHELTQLLESTKHSQVNIGNKTAPAFAKAHESFVHSLLNSATEASGYYLSLPGWAYYAPDGNLGPIPAGGSERYFTIAVILSHPLSRGSVHITTSSPSDPHLAIDPNYLSHPLDIEILARHAQFLESTLATSGLLGERLKLDGKRSPGAPPGPWAFEGDLDTVQKFLRETATGAMHYTGTCSMMPRGMGGVVDPELKVYSVKRGLRVCDASIMPLTTRGNPMATVYGIAERGAEIIKASLQTQVPG
ncbi:GMC oxidoreductase [Podospora didyma]|uniref:GMC oxidoreductase n=1 Tax=Podospora didyma TaxID=330526 RepID=A0AAE0N397_9PEZI|nr:GMC oxidoreductase [Podospora didyma]